MTKRAHELGFVDEEAMWYLLRTVWRFSAAEIALMIGSDKTTVARRLQARGLSTLHKRTKEELQNRARDIVALSRQRNKEKQRI